MKGKIYASVYKKVSGNHIIHFKAILNENEPNCQSWASKIFGCYLDLKN